MKDARGFTLIELMIVVAIIGILAIVALPSYRGYIIKGNRAATQAFMLDIANREKQYLLDARVYADGTMDSAGFISILNMTAPKDVYKNYTIDIDAPVTVGSPPTFTITSTPLAGSSQVGDGNLTLDDTGAKAHGATNHW